MARRAAGRVPALLGGEGARVALGVAAAAVPALANRVVVPAALAAALVHPLDAALATALAAALAAALSAALGDALGDALAGVVAAVVPLYYTCEPSKYY